MDARARPARSSGLLWVATTAAMDGTKNVRIISVIDPKVNLAGVVWFKDTRQLKYG